MQSALLLRCCSVLKARPCQKWKFSFQVLPLAVLKYQSFKETPSCFPLQTHLGLKKRRIDFKFTGNKFLKADLKLQVNTAALAQVADTIYKNHYKEIHKIVGFFSLHLFLLPGNFHVVSVWERWNVFVPCKKMMSRHHGAQLLFYSSHSQSYKQNKKRSKIITSNIVNDKKEFLKRDR